MYSYSETLPAPLTKPQKQHWLEGSTCNTIRNFHEYISSISKILCMVMVDSKFRRAILEGKRGILDKRSVYWGLWLSTCTNIFGKQFETCDKVESALYIRGFHIWGFNQPGIGGKKNSRKFERTNLEFALLTAIYIAFLLCWVL